MDPAATATQSPDGDVGDEQQWTPGGVRRRSRRRLRSRSDCDDAAGKGDAHLAGPRAASPPRWSRGSFPDALDGHANRLRQAGNGLRDSPR